MRLGISSSLEHSSPTDWAEKMTQLGCRSVVFPVNYKCEPEQITAYVNAAKGKDLQIAEVGIWKNAIAQDESERSAAMEYSIGQLRLADQIQARCCVNVAGAAGPLWDGGYRENYSQKTWDATVRMIQEIIDEVKPQHTWFTIEPMPYMIPTGPQEYLKLLEAVNRDRFAVHMDIINMINTPERYFFSDQFTKECFELLGPRIKSCHMKDIALKQKLTFLLQECACGEGSYGLEQYVELANAIDPDMPMIIEHLASDQDYYDSVAYVRKRIKQ